MGAVGGGALEVSVSFGRFENDSLSWDKWSSFSQNKYLEEVEKCSTPGSVAMKKAYFEAHYKQIAAKKALMDQQAQMESDKVKSDMPNDDVESEVYTPNDQYFTEEIIQKTPNGAFELETSTDQCLIEEIIQNTPNGAVELETSHDQCLIEEIIIKNPNDVKSEVYTSNDQCFTEELIEKTPNGDSETEIYTSNVKCFAEEILEKTSLIREDNSINANTSAVDSESWSVEQEREFDSRPDSPCSVKPEKVRLLKDETPSISIQDNAKVPKEFNNEEKQDPNVKKEILNLSSKSKKVTAIANVRNMARVTKKTSSPLIKAPQISTPRMSKPTLTSSTASVTRSSIKKGTNSSTPKSKNLFSTGERRRVVPSSLHMSVSLDPRNLDLSSPVTTRKSMIMEKMGDKDIVKRAFKTFQNNVNQFKSSRDEISSFPNQRKEMELKVPSSTTPRKDERSYKTGGVEGKSTKSVSSSISLKTNDRTETRKKFVKKLDEKSSTKGADKTHIQSKLKDQKDAEIKKMRQSLNFKATPLPSFYRGQQLSKILLNKDGSNNGTNR